MYQKTTAMHTTAITIPNTSKTIFSLFFTMLLSMIKGMTGINRHSYISAVRILS